MRIFPVILAAGRAPRLGFPQALAKIGARTALQVAVENCAGLERPVVVLGFKAAHVRKAVPRTARVVVNKGWRMGQITSLRAGLRRVLQEGAVLLYPVDCPLLTLELIQRLVRGYARREAGREIIVPVYRGRMGHPVIFSPKMRAEILSARTAREVVERDSQRVKLVRAESRAIWMDFDTPQLYRQCLRLLRHNKQS